MTSFQRCQLRKAGWLCPSPCAQNHLLCWSSCVRKPAFRNPRAEHRAVRVRINDDKSTGEGHFPGLIYGNVLFEGSLRTGHKYQVSSSTYVYIAFGKIHHGSICLCGYLRIEDLVWLSSTSIWQGPKLPPNGWLIWDGFLLAVPYYYHRLLSSSLSLFVYTIPLALPYDSVDLNLNIRR